MEYARDYSPSPPDKLCVTPVPDGGAPTEAGSPVQDAGSCSNDGGSVDSGG